MHRLRVLSVVAIVALLAVACGTGDADDGGSNGSDVSDPTQDDGAAGSADEELRHVVFATGSTTGGVHFANFEIGIPLGFYEEEGLEVEILHAGGNAPATAELESGRADFAVGTSSFQVNNYVDTGELPGVNYFEYTYPMKWEVLVAPGSPIQEVGDLEGTTIGIHSLGTADERVLTEWLNLGGADPASVDMIVTGGDLPAGVALQNGEVDAILAWDTHMGAYDAEGIEYEILPRPEGISEFGGFFIQATPETIEEDSEAAIGFARAVLKSTVFALENPEAAMALYLDLNPELGDGLSRDEAIERLITTAQYRMANWDVPHEGFLHGEIPDFEWENEVRFAGASDDVEDSTMFFTNELIDEINDVDLDAVRQMARDFDA